MSKRTLDVFSVHSIFFTDIVHGSAEESIPSRRISPSRSPTRRSRSRSPRRARSPREKRYREGERERERDRDREKQWDRDRDRNQDWDRDRDRDRSRQRGRNRDRDRDERDRDRDERNRERDRVRERDRERDSDKSVIKEEKDSEETKDNVEKPQKWVPPIKEGHMSGKCARTWGNKPCIKICKSQVVMQETNEGNFF